MSGTLIPKRLNAIWLGGVLSEDGQQNIQSWREKNPDYTVTLWVDSSLYDEEKKKSYQSLVKWAATHNIIIADVAISSSNNPTIRPAANVYEHMMSKHFYSDEINGEHRNLAAASDLLRLEILAEEGGAYIDAKDVYTTVRPLGQLQAKHGFLYNDQGNGSLNNDLLASAQHGELIQGYRKRVHNNYEVMYQNPEKVRAHRNPLFTSPYFYAGMQSRIRSTLELSGPDALYRTIEDFALRHHFTEEERKELHFDKSLYNAPDKTALSWIGTKAAKYDDLIPIFRNFVREHFHHAINKIIKQSHSSHEIELLKTFNQRLISLPTTLSLKDIYRTCVEGISANDLRNMQRVTRGLTHSLKNCCQSTEALAAFCEKEIDPETFRKTLKIGIMAPEDKKLDLKRFIRKVLDGFNGEPNLKNAVSFFKLKVDTKEEAPHNKPASHLKRMP